MRVLLRAGTAAPTVLRGLQTRAYVSPELKAIDRNIPLCIAIKDAPDFADVVQLCEENWDRLNIFHATAAIHRLGRTIGVKRFVLSDRWLSESLLAIKFQIVVHLRFSATL